MFSFRYNLHLSSGFAGELKNTLRSDKNYRILQRYLMQLLMTPTTTQNTTIAINYNYNASP